MTHKTLLLALIFIVTSTVICQDFDEQLVIRQEQEEKKEAERKQKVSALSYYSAHLATALAAKFLLDEVVAALESRYFWQHEPLSLHLVEDYWAILLATYIFYKAPQWTDNAIGIEEKRSFLGNVFSCVTRRIIPFPVGSLASEFVIRQDS